MAADEMSFLTALGLRRPFRRRNWNIWLYMHTDGTLTAVHESRIRQLPINPDLWPREPYRLLRTDYFMLDWEVEPEELTA